MLEYSSQRKKQRTFLVVNKKLGSSAAKPPMFAICIKKLEVRMVQMWSSLTALFSALYNACLLTNNIYLPALASFSMACRATDVRDQVLNAGRVEKTRTWKMQLQILQGSTCSSFDNSRVQQVPSRVDHEFCLSICRCRERRWNRRTTKTAQIQPP